MKKDDISIIIESLNSILQTLNVLCSRSNGTTKNTIEAAIKSVSDAIEKLNEYKLKKQGASF